jgi:hypothetical protein
MSLQSRSYTQQLYYYTQNKSYNAPLMPLLALIADYKCLAHTNRLRPLIELLTSKQNHYIEQVKA